MSHEDDQASEAKLPGPPRIPKRRRILTVADVAHIRGTTRANALKWLRRHADRFLYEGKRGLCIKAQAYALIEQAQSYIALASRINALEEEHARFERRMTAHANALSKLGAL